MILSFDEFLREGAYDQFANKAGAKFWGDVASGILPICKSTGRVLVAYRSKYVNEPHTWNLFGGKLDEGETDPRKAAERELTEESGYTGKFEIVPAYVFRTPDKSFEYHNFVGLVDEEFDPKFDWETETAEWVNLDELKKLEPKHFGLVELLKHGMTIIEKYAK